MLQEVFKEALIHLALCDKLIKETGNLERNHQNILKQVKERITDCTSRHGPVLLMGGHASGKTTLLTTIYSQCPQWLNTDPLRIVRFCGKTPRSDFLYPNFRALYSLLNSLLEDFLFVD